MNAKLCKKLCAFTLALVILLSLLPAGALAADTGILQVKAAVSGSANATTKAFDITVAFDQNITGSHYSINGRTPVPIPAQNTVTLSLSANQTAVFSGLPDGVTYTVAATDYSADGHIQAPANGNAALSGTISALTPSSAEINWHKDVETDIVLVLDNSGSMGGDNIARLQALKAAAVDFCEKTLTEQNKTLVRIGIVPFNTNALEPQSFKNYSEANLTELTTFLNSMTASGGTNIQEALAEAGEMFADNSTAEQKIVVLIADGAPSYSYKGAAAAAYTWPNTGYDFALSNFGSRLGNGTGYDLLSTYAAGGYTVDNHGIGTISAAKLLGDSGIVIHTIGLDTEDDANAVNVLKDCAYAGGGGFSVATTTTLSSVLAQALSVPKVVGLSPGGAGVALSGSIAIAFDTPMGSQKGTVSLDGGNTALPEGDWQQDGKTYITTYTGLAETTEYTVSISGFKNAAGVAMLPDSTHTFITGIVPPVLKAGSVSRTGNKEATISFSSDKDGTFYYIVKAAAEAAPADAAAVKAGGESDIMAANNTITNPVGLAAGNMVIYIVGEDARGLISDVLAIDIKAYNPGGGMGSGAPGTEPKIDGSSGWSKITEKVGDMKDGDSLTIDMNGTTTVPGDFFEAVAGKDVDVSFDMGNGITWTVNGKDIPVNTELGVLNLGVSSGGEYFDAVVQNIDDSLSEVQLRLAHNGAFGFKLTLSVKLDKKNAGYFANLYYYNAENGELEFQGAAKIAADGTVDFVFDHASDYLIVVAQESLAPETPWQNPFTDIKEDDWFYANVQYVVENGLFQGLDATSFGPDTPMTRAMLVTVLWRMAGEPAALAAGNSFSDVEDGRWYTSALLWAAQQKIVTGYGDGLFGTNDPISRQDMAVILERYLRFADISISVTEEYRLFSDEDNIADYAKNAVQLMNKLSVIQGVGDNAINPQAPATRAEVAAMLQRFLEVIGRHAEK